MGLELKTKPYYDNGGGLDLRSSPTKTGEDFSTDSLNVDYTNDGAIVTRDGSRIVNQIGGVPQPIAGNPRGLLFFDYKNENGDDVQILAAGTDLYHGLVNPVAQGFSFDPSEPIPDMEFFVALDDEYMIWGNGIDNNQKFDGTSYSNLSISPPTLAPIPSDNGAGLLPAGTYNYYYTFARVTAGTVEQESDLSPLGSVTIAANRQIQIVNFEAPTDPQVTNRIIYRESPSSTPDIRRLAIVGIGPLVYNDNNPIDSLINGFFDNQAAPNSAVFEEYLRRMYYVDSNRRTDVFYSKPDLPWSVPNAEVANNAGADFSDNRIIFDGPVQCIVKCFGTLIFGTDKSLWVLNGDIEFVEPRRISSKIGIINNRCAVGETYLYIMATNRKVYRIDPTSFSQDEMRLDKPLSIYVEPFIRKLDKNETENIAMVDYTSEDISKIAITMPVGKDTNNHILIYNETQSFSKKHPVWQIWNNINAAAILQMNVNNELNIYSADYNGLIWQLEVPNIHGDGAEINGTVTSATATTLTDNTQTFIVDEHLGKTVRLIGGTGEDQVRTIISNTADTLTISTGSTDWIELPDVTTEYTIGGYDVYHFSNWKFVLDNYESLKQLWYIFVNANAFGDYEIDIILQSDFRTTEDDSLIIPFSLNINNTIWGSFLWGFALWGGASVFEDVRRAFMRFRAIRIGFRNREAGQPFQINGFSISCQYKGLFYASS